MSALLYLLEKAMFTVVPCNVQMHQVQGLCKELLCCALLNCSVHWRGAKELALVVAIGVVSVTF